MGPFGFCIRLWTPIGAILSYAITLVSRFNSLPCLGLISALLQEENTGVDFLCLPRHTPKPRSLVFQKTCGPRALPGLTHTLRVQVSLLVLILPSFFTLLVIRTTKTEVESKVRIAPNSPRAKHSHSSPSITPCL
jgi:hypothetical protein